MIQPFKSLFLLFYVACFTVVIMVMSPSEIGITQEWSFRIFSLDDILPASPQETADIAFTQDLAKQVEDAEETENQITTNTTQQASTIKKDSSKVIRNKQTGEIHYTTTEDTAFLAKQRENKPVRQFIEYPDDSKEAMKSFFKSLASVQGSGKVVRVVHYGDSQLEGDRISKYLRQKLQGRFGGCGVGLVPMRDRSYIRSTLITNFSENWKKFAYLDSPKRPATNKLGLLASYFKFTGDKPSETVQQAWVKFSSPTNKGRFAKVENVKLLYKNPYQKMALEVRLDSDSLLYKENVGVSEDFTVLELPIDKGFKKITLKFGTSATPDFYGVCLDCKEGVAVDNVPIRGSSGVEFSKMSGDFLKEQVKEMNVKLMIVQFGVNVVPGVLSNYDFYEKQFSQQLKFLKSLHPDMSILVVGVSDMARKRSGRMESYPNIEKIRDAQRKAAFKAGCAFWDLYSAMGGRNSMVSWVLSKPTLASPDYTHFNDRGATLVGEMLFNSLINEYESFQSVQ